MFLNNLNYCISSLMHERQLWLIRSWGIQNSKFFTHTENCSNTICHIWNMHAFLLSSIKVVLLHTKYSESRPTLAIFYFTNIINALIMWRLHLSSCSNNCKQFRQKPYSNYKVVTLHTRNSLNENNANTITLLELV